MNRRLEDYRPGGVCRARRIGAPAPGAYCILSILFLVNVVSRFDLKFLGILPADSTSP